jgi:hypothetical protein
MNQENQSTNDYQERNQPECEPTIKTESDIHYKRKNLSVFHIIILFTLTLGAAWFWFGGSSPSNENQPVENTERVETINEATSLAHSSIIKPEPGQIAADQINAEKDAVINSSESMALETTRKVETVEADPATLLFGVVSRIRVSRNED